MAPALQGWPWGTLKLIAFSSPVVGDSDFTTALNKRDPAHNIFPDNPRDASLVQTFEKDKAAKEFAADFGDDTKHSVALVLGNTPALFHVHHPDDFITWAVPQSAGMTKCGTVSDCSIGIPLLVANKARFRKPGSRFHEPYDMFKEMRCLARGAITAPAVSQNSIVDGKDDFTSGGATQYISQFYSMMRDTSFDFPAFRQADTWLEHRQKDGTCTRTDPPAPQIYRNPQAPSATDATGGPIPTAAMCAAPAAILAAFPAPP
jgi:hypothetical protein